MGKKHSQTIEIPPQYSPGKTTIVLMEDFEASVGEIHDQAKRDHIRDHNHTVGQMELEGSALTNGRRALAQKNPTESRVAKRKREKEEAAHRRLLRQYLDRLEDLYRQIEVINQRLEQIDTELTELQRLQKLAEDGTLDPNNFAHAELLRKYGMTKEDIEKGSLSLILADKLGQRFHERTELQNRKESLVNQAQEVIHEAQAGGMMTPEDAEHFRQGLESSEVGVSAVVWDLNESSEAIKTMATDRFNSLLDEEGVADGLQLPKKGSGALSFAASLDNTPEEGKMDTSLTEKFASISDPAKETPTVEHAVSQLIVPGRTNA